MFYREIINTICETQKARSDETMRCERGTISFLREFRTISLDFGRQTGKTKAMMQLLRENPTSRLVTFNARNYRELATQYPEQAGQLLTLSQFKDKAFRDTGIEHLIFEEPIFNQAIQKNHEFWEDVSRVCPEHVVFIGMLV